MGVSAVHSASTSFCGAPHLRTSCFRHSPPLGDGLCWGGSLPPGLVIALGQVPSSPVQRLLCGPELCTLAPGAENLTDPEGHCSHYRPPRTIYGSQDGSLTGSTGLLPANGSSTQPAEGTLWRELACPAGALSPRIQQYRALDLPLGTCPLQPLILLLF